jgi:hypothetical protein
MFVTVHAMFGTNFFQQVQRRGHGSSRLGINRKILRRILGHHLAKGSSAGPVFRALQVNHRAIAPVLRRIIQQADSLIVTDGSLSTFDRFVSCLYFFESE